jgi:hypothetical protein
MEEKNKMPKQNFPEINKKERGRDLGVILLNLLLAIVTIVLLGYIAYRNGYINLDNILNSPEETVDIEEERELEEKEEQEEGKSVKENQQYTEEPVVLDTFEGETLSAVLPEGWEIIEYFDGEGTDMLDPGTTYSGLTGLQILSDGEEIMRIEGVSGIGFIGCQELPRFSDSSPEYEQEQEDLNEEIIEEEIEYLDYTDVPYSEFNWFGRRFRRVGAALYYDTVEDDEFFQPQCEVSFFRLEDLGFEDADGYPGDTYMYTISQDATENQLKTLDQILISMTAN